MEQDRPKNAVDSLNGLKLTARVERRMGSTGVFVDHNNEPIGWLGVPDSLLKEFHQQYAERLASHINSFSFKEND
jgi:hypothetical protein